MKDLADRIIRAYKIALMSPNRGTVAALHDAWVAYAESWVKEDAELVKEFVDLGKKIRQLGGKA